MIEHFTHSYFVKGRDDLLANIHRKTSSGFSKPVVSGGKQRGPGSASGDAPRKATVGGGGGAFSSGLQQKETRHMQQLLMEHDDKLSAIHSDVEVSLMSLS
jgi:hypothetical protein